MEVFLDNLCKAWKSLCFHCVFFLLIVIAAFDQVEIIPGILTISYLVFNILHVSCLFVCFMFCSFSIHRNSKAYWGWGEGRGEGMERGKRKIKCSLGIRPRKSPVVGKKSTVGNYIIQNYQKYGVVKISEVGLLCQCHLCTFTMK